MSSKPLVSDTGKTIDDYRLIIKQLKIKTKNLQDHNRELEEKLSEIRSSNFDPKSIENLMSSNISQLKVKENIKPDQSFSICSNETVMKEVLKSAQKIGLNFEMLYRAADVNCKHSILLDDFRIFLNKIKLGLTQSQTSRLLYIFDEDCSGIIQKDNYNDILMAYGVNSEQVSSTSRSLGQQSLLKYVNLLNDKRVDVETSYTNIDTKGTGSFNDQQLSDYLKTLDKDYSQKERAALFNYMDFNQKSIIPKQQYIDVIQKAISSKNKPSSDGALGGGNSADNLSAIKKKFELKTNKPFTFFLRSLLLNLKNAKRGIVLRDVEQTLNQVKSQLTLSEIFQVFRAMDLNKNGSIYYDDLLSFFIEHKIPTTSFMTLIINQAKLLEATDISTDQFLKEQKIFPDTVVKKSEFAVKMQCLGIFKDEAEKLFQEIDVDGDGDLTGQNLIDLFNQFRSDVEQKDVVEAKQVNNRDQKEVKLIKNEYNSLKYFTEHPEEWTQIENNINTLKSKIDDKDKFTQEGVKVQTIFKGEDGQNACLKECIKVVSEMKKQNYKRWSDPDFGKIEKDPNGFNSLYFFENMLPPSYIDPENIEWLHPEQIWTKSDPVFIDEDGMSGNDVMQSGFIGNCWFVSALSIIAAGHDHLIRGEYANGLDFENLKDSDIKGLLTGVYPPIFHWLRDYGIYVMKFFKNYEWHYVMIDTTLPVYLGELMMGHCRPPADEMVPREYWVSMVEKAFAKIHGSYQALFSGYIDDALTDMTGFAAEKRELSMAQFQTEEQKESFWQSLKQYFKDECMLGCSADGGTEHNIMVDEQDTGLKSGHAYAIIDCLEIPAPEAKNKHKSHRLLRIRNPWGFGEWELKWSEKEGDEENPGKLKQNLQKIQDYYANLKKNGAEIEEFDAYADDGTFLMCYKDWRSIFHNMFISINFPDQWNGKRLKDDWTKEVSGGFPMKQTEENFIKYAKDNNQYLIECQQDTQIFVSCGQTDGRLYRGLKYPYPEKVHCFNMLLWKLDETETKLEKFDPKKLVKHTGKLKVVKEICLPRLSIPKGKYVVIPSTKEAGDVGHYTLNVYYDNDTTKLSKIGSDKQFGVIAEEEEGVQKQPEELKSIIKIVSKFMIQS